MRAALDQVGLLGRERTRPIELSAGEQQRVGIARAVVGKPTLLIADEPTGNLDPDLAVEVMNMFKRFNEVGVTVLIATHDIHLIERFGVRRVILAKAARVGAWDAPSARRLARNPGGLHHEPVVRAARADAGRLAGPALAQPVRDAADDRS